MRRNDRRSRARSASSRRPYQTSRTPVRIECDPEQGIERVVRLHVMPGCFASAHLRRVQLNPVRSRLLENGADVNARANYDSAGIGGHTPIFHAVNSIFNYCRAVVEILITAGADLGVQVKSLLWGETMSWETVLFDIKSHLIRSVRPVPAVSSARGAHLQQH